MPIKIHDNLPARKLLQNEIVDVIDSSTAEKQDIRPLKFLLLNLMPKKLETEVQFARLLGASPLQVELTLMTTDTYSPKNTKKEHLIEFYKTLEDIKNDFVTLKKISFNKNIKIPKRLSDFKKLLNSDNFNRFKCIFLPIDAVLKALKL